jgi:hypothetical protein
MGDNAVAMMQEDQQLRIPINGQPWLNTIGWPEPQSLVKDLHAVLGGNRGHVDSCERGGWHSN